MAIPTKIKQLANDVRTKIYGRDVRESIAKGMEVSGEISEESNNRSKDTAGRQDHIEARYDVAVGAHTEDSEMLDARVNADGSITFDNLKKRLDYEYNINYRRLVDLGVSVKDFGAVGDGITDDTEAIQEAVNTLSEGETLYFPNGTYIIDYVIFINKNITIKGASREHSIVKVKDNSTLFHNSTRDNSDRSKKTGKNLFRDYHSVFFYDNANVDIKGLTIDGNYINQRDIVNNVYWNYVGPDIGDKSRSYYKYFHLIQTLFDDGESKRVNVHDCIFKGSTWNNLCINNNGQLTELEESSVYNNKFYNSAQDMLSIHRIDGLDIFGNTFDNPNTHSLHVYYDASNVNIFDNSFVNDDEIEYVVPNDENRITNDIILGHASYASVIRDIKIFNNQFDNKQIERHTTAIMLSGATIRTNITGNNIIESDYGIFVTAATLGVSKISHNSITARRSSLIFRINTPNGILSPLPPGFSQPVNGRIDINSNKCGRVGPKTDTDVLIDKPNYDEENLDLFIINFFDNEYSSLYIDRSLKYVINISEQCGSQSMSGVINYRWHSNRRSYALLDTDKVPTGGRTHLFGILGINDSRLGYGEISIEVDLTGSTPVFKKENIRGELSTHYDFEYDDKGDMYTIRIVGRNATSATINYNFVGRTHNLYKASSHDQNDYIVI